MIDLRVMKLLRYIGLAILVIGLFGAPVLAQGNESLQAARDERRAEAERNYPQDLSDAEKSRVSSRCVAAQSRVTELGNALEARVGGITGAYDLIDRQLAAVSKRLKAHELDTSTSDVLLVAYRRQTNALKESISKYRMALSDVVAIDCKANPEAFKSLLENARVRRKDVADAISSVNNVLENDMPASFESIKRRLSTPSGGGER